MSAECASQEIIMAGREKHPKPFSEQSSQRLPSSGDSISMRSKSSQQSQDGDSRENSTESDKSNGKSVFSDSAEGGGPEAGDNTLSEDGEFISAKSSISEEAIEKMEVDHPVSQENSKSPEMVTTSPVVETSNPTDEAGGNTLQERMEDDFVADAPAQPSIEEDDHGSASTCPVYTERPRAQDVQFVPRKPSPDNSENSLSLSMDVVSIESFTENQPLQETGDQYDKAQHVKLRRMKIVKYIISKSLLPCHVKPMKVAIPIQFSPNTPSFADLLVSYIPYRKEYTDWPDRFFYISLKLTIPPQFVHAMTVNHFCWLVLKLSVTSSSCGAQVNGMLENLCAQVKEIDLTEKGGDVHYDLCTTLRHSVLIDSCCDKVIFSLFATFKTEKREKKDEEFRLSLIDRNFIIVIPH